MSTVRRIPGKFKRRFHAVLQCMSTRKPTIKKIKEAAKNIAIKCGYHFHEKKLFCVGEIAFVKCKTCGDESIPWQVRKSIADDWHESHPNAMEELLEINNKLGTGFR